MTNNTYSVGIVGMGIAGCFAALKLATTHKNMKVIGFDCGRPPMKRRQQMFGWLGVLPNSDGKLYESDVSKVAELTGLRRAKSAHTWVKHTLDQIYNFKVIKDRAPNTTVDKRLKKFGYDIALNDYVQMYPKEIHMLSKHMAETIELNPNVSFVFDNEVIRIVKQKNMFVISTGDQEYRCKKLIIAAGRSGWRWTSNLYKSLGIIDNNDIARFGIRVEINSNMMKDFNRSNCTITKGDMEFGPFSWAAQLYPKIILIWLFQLFVLMKIDGKAIKYLLI